MAYEVPWDLPLLQTHPMPLSPAFTNLQPHSFSFEAFNVAQTSGLLHMLFPLLDLLFPQFFVWLTYFHPLSLGLCQLNWNCLKPSHHGYPASQPLTCFHHSIIYDYFIDWLLFCVCISPPQTCKFPEDRHCAGSAHDYNSSVSTPASADMVRCSITIEWALGKYLLSKRKKQFVYIKVRFPCASIKAELLITCF